MPVFLNKHTDDGNNFKMYRKHRHLSHEKITSKVDRKNATVGISMLLPLPKDAASFKWQIYRVEWYGQNITTAFLSRIEHDTNRA